MPVHARQLSLPLVAVIILALSVLPAVGLGAPAQAAVEGGTQAPDLLTVDNFRPGTDVNGNGTIDTLVDFTFDQAAAVASCCAGINLVPVAGAPPLVALSVEEGADTTTLTFAFDDAVTAATIARGTVDINSVRVSGGGDATNNPPQAADVTADGVTADPDLVSVTRDGDQMLFEFDESISEDDDVVQNTSGLRFYTEQAEVYNSSVVRTVEGNVSAVRAIYDLPAGVTLDDAVGGFAIAGTVVGDMLNPNELDELAPVDDTGAMVCAAPASIGSVGDGNGPTTAPDLLRVDNFRRGPFTSTYEPTTCVDFTFDQVAYLNGGNRSSFSLAPLDGGDALNGTTNLLPPNDVEGDSIVTVVFPGDLTPADFARGFVATGVANSTDGNVTSADPGNINQSADIAPDVVTENPDLVDVKCDGDAYLFTFDEALTDDDVIQNSSGLRLYFPESQQTSTIPFAPSSRVEVVDPVTLRAFYETLPGDYTLADAVGAYAVQGTVQAAQGSRGGNDGKNAFHEVPLTGQDPATCGTETSTSTTTDDNGTDAAISQSQGRFSDAGSTTSSFAQEPRAAAFAVVAREDVFADSLTGSVLTGDAPLLFTGADGLDPKTDAEIDRILDDGGTVYLLGGENALPQTIEQTLVDDGYDVRRLAGPSRIETAIAVADEATALYGAPDTTAVARAYAVDGNPTSAWVDAVTGGAWAADTGNPILLTPTDAVHPAVAQWLDGHPDTQRVVLGEAKAISDVTAEQLDARRVGGVNRYATAVAIATELWESPDGSYIIANGADEDAWTFILAAAGRAADTDQPILLVEADVVPDETDDLLCADGSRAQTEVIGSNRLIGDQVREQLNSPCG